VSSDTGSPGATDASAAPPGANCQLPTVDTVIHLTVVDLRELMQPKRGHSPGRGLFGQLTTQLLARRQRWPGSTGAIKPPPRAFDNSRDRYGDGHDSNRGNGGRLVGRRALVTGADSDWGWLVAMAFADQGADVVCSYLPQLQPQPQSQPQQRRAIEVMTRSKHGAGRHMALVPGDLRTEQGCHQLIADSVRGLGGLDILVIDAARLQPVADIAMMTTEQFDATFRSNIHAMFWLTKSALPHLAPGSSIINTGAPAGAGAGDIQLDYSASKGAITVFTRCLAQQLAGRGIRVNAVAPAPIWTPRSLGGEPPVGDAANCGGNRDHGSRSQLASLYVLLASTESSYATGQLYGAVDAGADGASPGGM
jgi:NAD(P)-dependent dehydrogenase (short-subunit alcohol dehydrogenase family)